MKHISTVQNDLLLGSRVVERYASPVVGSHFDRLCCLRHGSGRVFLGTGDPSSLMGPFLHALTLIEGVRLIAWRLKHPSLGECRRNFLELPGGCGLRPCARTHLKKALCRIPPVGGPGYKYRSRVADTTNSTLGRFGFLTGLGKGKL